MKVSIIGSAYNEERLIAETLRCIQTAAAAFVPPLNIVPAPSAGK